MLMYTLQITINDPYMITTITEHQITAQQRSKSSFPADRVSLTATLRQDRITEVTIIPVGMRTPIQMRLDTRAVMDMMLLLDTKMTVMETMTLAPSR